MVLLNTFFKKRRLSRVGLTMGQTVMLGLSFIGSLPVVALAANSNTQTNIDTHTKTCTFNGVLIDCVTREPIVTNSDITVKQACPERIYEPIYGKYCNYRVDDLEFVAVKLSHKYGGAGFDEGIGLSQAYAMNDNTDIVGQAITSSGELHAVYVHVGASFYNDHYFSDYGIDGVASSARAISNNNTVVGGVQGDLNTGLLTEAIWHSQIGMNYTLDALGGIQGVALDIARDRMYKDYVVGHGVWSEGENADGKSHGFLWSFDGSRKEVSVIGKANEENWALAVNDSRVAVGYLNDDDQDSAYLWNGSVIVALPDYEGPSRAININNNAQSLVVGYAADLSHQHAVYWQDGAITRLKSLDGASVSAATAATDGLDIVGYSGGSAVIWRAGEVYDLNDLVIGGTTFRLTRAIDMNRQGRILVEGEDGFYLLVPMEEPSASLHLSQWLASNSDGVGNNTDLDDSDGDGMPNGWERANGLDPLDPNDASLDGELDGLTNLQEYENDSDPNLKDTDNDGMSDGGEVLYVVNSGADGTVAPDDLLDDTDPDASSVQADVCPSGCTYASIQIAVDNAAANETITVGPGVYNESIVINIPLSLKSANSSTDTIIDATGLQQSVLFLNEYATIDGFTIMGGEAIYGGGINVSGSGANIRNNIIKNNYADADGGGVYALNYTSLLVENNSFESNLAGKYGGAVKLGAYKSRVINRNVFKGNSARDGGAIAVSSYGSDIVKNNVFVDNVNTIFANSYASTKFLNNTIVGSTGYAARKGAYGLISMTNTILWNNSSNFRGWGWGVKNSLIDVDPMFVDPANNDYRLLPDSPAIDAGMDVTNYGVIEDFDMTVRPQDGDRLGVGSTGDGSDYDIGAFEFQ